MRNFRRVAVGLGLGGLVHGLAFAQAAAAHDEHASVAQQQAQHTPIALHWTWDPLLTLVLTAAVIAYARGTWVVWQRAGAGQGVRAHQVASFVVAWLVLVAALLSPLDGLSDVLFSAHMSQHELLMLVAAPLLVIAKPLLAALWSLPEPARGRVAAWSRRAHVQQGWRTITNPLLALVVHGVVRWVWHAPFFYEAALASERVHAVQHAMFFFTATAFWWALVHGRYGRAGYGVGVFFVFATAMHAGALAALVTFARSAWYPTYVERAVPYGVDALDDQRLAGLLMWVPAGVVMMVAGLALFAAWLGEIERRSNAASRSAA